MMSIIIQQFLKQQKKNKLLLNELQQKQLLSTVTIQAISSNLARQEKEVIDHYNCLLFLERRSNQLFIKAVDEEVSKSSIAKRMKTKLLLWIALIKIDLKLLSIA